MLSGRDWQEDNCLSLAGIYKPKKNIEESTPPASLIQYLIDFPQIDGIVLHLDNDVPGRLAAKTIKTLLFPSFAVFDELSKRGKDMNDYLKIRLSLQRPKELERP